MFTGEEIVTTLEGLGITHVVWVPDSVMGQWEAALEASKIIRLVRVCREGEAWPLAAGLYLGGQMPLVVMQTTGLFESGDALRNVLFDLKLPLLAIIGVRNGLVPSSRDSAKVYAEPILKAWGIDCVGVASFGEKPRLAGHFLACWKKGSAGAVLLAEGAM